MQASKTDTERQGTTMDHTQSATQAMQALATQIKKENNGMTYLQADTQAQYIMMAQAITYTQAIEMPASEMVAYRNMAVKYMVNGSEYATKFDTIVAYNDAKKAHDEIAEKYVNLSEMVNKYTTKYTQTWDYHTEELERLGDELTQAYKDMQRAMVDAYNVWHNVAEDRHCVVCHAVCNAITCDACYVEVYADDACDCGNDIFNDDGTCCECGKALTAYTDMADETPMQALTRYTDTQALVNEMQALAQKINMSELPLPVISAMMQALQTMKEYTK